MSRVSSNRLPVLMLPDDAIRLRDNQEWQHRFEIGSDSSQRTYVVAQHKVGRYWGCSCPGWRTRRTCKHLDRFALPGQCLAHEVSEVRQIGQASAPVTAKPATPVAGRFITWDDSDV